MDGIILFDIILVGKRKPRWFGAFLLRLQDILLKETKARLRLDGNLIPLITPVKQKSQPY